MITNRRTFGEVLRKGGKTFPMKGEPPSSLPFQRLLCLSSFCFRHSPKRRLWEMPDVSKLELSALAWHEVVHFRSAVDIRPFSVFPLAGFMAEALYWLSLWNFKKEGCIIENGWCFFPWSSKGITGKMPWLWIPPRGKLEKKLHFHRAVRWNNYILWQSLLEISKE